jgi:beta-galactosidase
MVQVENEYGSFGNDRTYLDSLRKLWVQQGITVPFYTADGPTAFMLEAGSLDGCAIGLDSGSGDADFEQARGHNPNVPAFSSESYPGWLTHWKEPWQKPDTAGILREVAYLLSHKRSFNLYVVHGGTNFGFTAGANAFTPVQFQPDVTSYDYDAPVSEQGQATPKYYALRRLISQQVSYRIPEPPAPIPMMEIPPVKLEPFTSVWDHLPTAKKSPQPLPMEAFDQKAGLILYRTRLIGHKSGALTITEPHDYALVFLNGRLIDTVFRDGGKWTVQLPKTDTKDPVLEILVEGMGHINFAQYMIDRKGITDRVTLNGMTLMNWDIFSLPRDGNYMRGVLGAGGEKMGTPVKGAASGAASEKSSPGGAGKQGVFFKGGFDLSETADTYIDMSQFKKGVAWVNGHNLGRYWYVGPQQHLYCPASWLKKGRNELIVLDLHQQEAAVVRGVRTLE